MLLLLDNILQSQFFKNFGKVVTRVRELQKETKYGTDFRDWAPALDQGLENIDNMKIKLALDADF